MNIIHTKTIDNSVYSDRKFKFLLSSLISFPPNLPGALSLTQMYDQMIFNVIIDKIKDQIKLKMNNNDKIPLTIGLAIEEIICRKTFFIIAPDELSKVLESAIEFSLLISTFSKKDDN